MRKLLLFAIVLGSCTTGLELKSVDYGHLLNDSNSKVWLVNKTMIENAVISPVLNIDKDVLIFYRSGHFRYVPYRQLSEMKGQKGFYFLNSEERTLDLEFDNNGKWKFSLPYLTEDSILLQNAMNSDSAISLQIIPLPEY